MSKRSHSLPSMAALRAFEAAASELSFTAAASELVQTQGAISHQIRELESRLGLKLFNREARGITLSEAGRLYLPFVREALSRLRDGERALRPSSAEHVLTVSCSPNFAQKWLVPRLGCFYADNPLLDLRISASPQHVTFDGDGIDIAIRHGDGQWPGLAVSQLCEEWLFPVCSPRLEPAIAGIQCIDDLRDYVLIHDRQRNGQRNGQRGGWARWLQANGAEPATFDLDRGPQLSQTSLAIDAAVSAQGVALARSALVGLDLAAGRLVRPLAHELPADFAYWIVCPHSQASAPKIVRFREWLMDQADDLPHHEEDTDAIRNRQ